MELDTIETGETPYEYVIVDEAARVAPPDLMIPLAKGKHIILVGDQRQLPQQVDQEIERQLEEATANKDKHIANVNFPIKIEHKYNVINIMIINKLSLFFLILHQTFYFYFYILLEPYQTLFH